MRQYQYRSTAHQVIILTFAIVVPFSVSSIIIILGPERSMRFPLRRRLGYPQFISIIGFVFLVILLGALVYLQFYRPPVSTSAEECAINPESYGITHPSDCSKFTPGSLAQDCALHPEKYTFS